MERFCPVTRLVARTGPRSSRLEVAFSTGDSTNSCKSRGEMAMRWNLPQDRIPEAWFNVAPHLPQPLRPPLHPGTKEPVGPDDLAPLFPMALIGQEMTAEPWVDIPGQVLDVLRLWRPTPL